MTEEFGEGFVNKLRRARKVRFRYWSSVQA